MTINLNKPIYILFSLTVLFLGCTDNEELLKHSRLIGYQSTFVGEPTDPTSSEYEKLANSKKVETEIRDHYMIITTWYIVNACGNHIPNLDIKNDTISLIYKGISEELCMSLSIKEVTYFIDNRDDKDWTIIK